MKKQVFRVLMLGMVLALLQLWGGSEIEARPIAFQDTDGKWKVMDDRDWPQVPEEKLRKPGARSVVRAGTVTFNVVYLDVVNNTGVGYDDPTEGADRRNTINGIFAYLSTLFDHNSTCDVHFQNSQTDGSGALATGGSSFFVIPNTYQRSLAQKHIIEGTDPSPTSPDVSVTMDFGWPWHAGTDPCPGGQLDLYTVMLHEITHGLGILSACDNVNGASGTSGLGTNVRTIFDGLLYTGTGTKLFDATGAYQGDGDSLLGGDSGVYFHGTSAAATFGGNVPIYAPTTWAGGSSISHWINTLNPVPVMNYNIGYATERRTYLPFEISAFEDIGYQLNDLTPPGPSDLFINEFNAINGAEFVEIYNGGESAVDMAAQDVVLIHLLGSSDEVYHATDLTGSIAAGDHYVLAESGATEIEGYTVDQNASWASLGDGPAAFVLVYGAEATDFPSSSDFSTALAGLSGAAMLDAVIYGETDSGLQSELSLSVQAPVSPYTSTGRVSDGQGGAAPLYAASDWSVQNLTPGAANGALSSTDVATIAEVQASDRYSLLRLTGTVTVVAGTNALKNENFRVYVQDTSGTDFQSALFLEDPDFLCGRSYQRGDQLKNMVGYYDVIDRTDCLILTQAPEYVGTGNPTTHNIGSGDDPRDNTAELLKLWDADVETTGVWEANHRYSLIEPSTHLSAVTMVTIPPNSALVGEKIPEGKFHVEGIGYQNEYARGEIMALFISDIDSLETSDGVTSFTEASASGLESGKGNAGASGDFNRDGYPDIISVNNLSPVMGNNYSAVYLNDGYGTLTWSQDLGTLYLEDVAVGDLNGDGWDDAFLASDSGTRNNTVWLNDGTGTLADSGQTLGTSNSEAVALGDLDNDGDLDAVVLNPPDGNLHVWLNDGDGNFTFTFAPVTVNTTSQDIALGDMDKDGILDVVIADTAQSRIWYGNGTGGFDSNLTFGDDTDAHGAVVLADFSRNGMLDVFVSGYEDTPSQVYVNSGSFLSGGNTLDTGNGRGLACADLDLDGDLDVVEANIGDIGSNLRESAVWWINDGNGNFHRGPAIQARNYNSDVVLADFDQDGDPDIYQVNTGLLSGAADQVFWNTLNHGEFHFTADTLLAEEYTEPTAVITGQFNPGFVEDVVVAQNGTNASVMLYSSTRLGISPTLISDAENDVVDMAKGDFDQDGLLDLAVANGGSNEIILLQGQGAVADWSRSTVETGNDFQTVESGDLDNDGDMDLMAFSYSQSRLVWYENDGTPFNGEWTETIMEDSLQNGKAITLGDVDGDGDLDAIGGYEHDTNGWGIGWWENPTWTLHDIVAAGTPGMAEVSFCDAVDMDGDSDLDLLLCIDIVHALGWIENTTGDGGSWGSVQRIASSIALTDAFSAVVGDLDKDGDVEVAGIGMDGELKVFNGSGSSWSSLTIEDSLNLGAVPAGQVLALSDTDGDGDLDLTAALYGENRVLVYENHAAQVSAEATPLASGPLTPGSSAPLFQVDLEHKGKAGDGEAVFYVLELKADNGNGQVFNGVEMANLVSSLNLYLDDGSGSLETGTDTLVDSFTVFQMPGDGVMRFRLDPTDTGLQIAPGAMATFFLSMATQATVAENWTRNLHFTLSLENSSEAINGKDGLPLRWDNGVDGQATFFIGSPAESGRGWMLYE